MRWATSLSASIVASIVLAATSSHATGAEPARLRYEVEGGVEGCPDAEGLRGAVATRLGYDPFRDEARRQLTARIARAGRDLRGDIELRDEQGAVVGARSLTGRTCAELAPTIAFAISMAIDPVRAMAAPGSIAPAPSAALPPPPAPAASSEAPSPPAPARDAPPPPPPPRVEPPTAPFVPRVYAGLGLAGLGPVAGVAGLVTVGAGVRHGAAAIDLEGRFLPASSESVAGGSVRTSTLGVGVLPCAYVDLLFLCAEVTIGALQGQAEGVDAPGQATTLFVQAGARVGVAIPLQARVTIEPEFDGLATLTRTRINFRGQEVWSTSGFGLSGGARVAVHFP